MKKKIIFNLVAKAAKSNLFIILFSAVAIISVAIWAGFENKKTNQVCFKNNCFEVELAVTAEEQTKGLMFRENLGIGKGMLFVFSQEGEYSFWMKNTLIPLDIIWIDKDKKVVFISENTQPCLENDCPSISPGKKAQYVLEVKGGTVQKISLAIDDKMDIEISLP